MLENPHTLIDLPQDLLGQDSRIWASDVYSVTGARKRKRTELALAIDGETVNIYDVLFHLKDLPVMVGTF